MDGQLDHAVEAFDFERDATIERRMHLICLEVNDNGQEYEEVEQRKRKIKRKTPRSHILHSRQISTETSSTTNSDQNDNTSNDFETNPIDESKESKLESQRNDATTQHLEPPQSEDNSTAQPSRIVFSAIPDLWPTEAYIDDIPYENGIHQSEKVLYDYSSPLM